MVELLTATINPHAASIDLTAIGVIWSGDHVFEGVPQTLEFLRSKG